MKLFVQKNKWTYACYLFFAFFTFMSVSHADESSTTDPSSPPVSSSPINPPPLPACTTVTVVVNGPDWVPSASYQPCDTPAGTQETWYLPWKVGERGYSETKEVVSGSASIIGRTGASCSLGKCTTFTPIGDAYKIDSCGCISGVMPGCIQGKASSDHCEVDECSP
jgi:hypothetical protein